MAIKVDLSGAIRTFDWTKVPAGWKFELLGNIATIRRGASPRPAGDPRYFGGKIPWFKIGDATRSPSRYLWTTEEFVNEEGAKHSVRVPAGSLIVSNSGVSLGFAVIPQVEGCIHDGWLLLDNFRDVERDYLYYCINLLTSRIRQMADGTTQPNLNTDIARRLLIPLPPQTEQRAIAYLLGTLDEKIGLNRRMNETLELLARAIFKSWFADFDPVRAKSEGRQPFGLDAETTALFSDSFQDSPVGKIPKGWKPGHVGELAELSHKTFNPGDAPDEVFDHYSLPAFDENHWPAEQLGSQIKSNKTVVPTDAVLLSKLNPRIPRIWLPQVNPSRRSVASTEFLVATSKVGVSREYLFCLFSSNAFLDVFESLVTGTSGSHQRVKPEFLLAMQAVIPPFPLIGSFTRLVAPLLAQYVANLAESRILASLRDTLLPKLISGDIRIGQAGKLVEVST
jgi:type I restriction enzyme, S subunit